VVQELQGASRAQEPEPEPEFNGRFGTVLDFVSDRVAVLVDDGDEGSRILLKKWENLERVSRRCDPDFDSDPDYDSDDACQFRKPWDSD
jgi:hypothetical protein